MKTFHKPLPILSLFALLLVAVWACRKEKPAFDLSDKDPCSCAQEVSAEFDIFETVYIYHLQEFWRIPSDTVITGTIGFQAKDLTADEYIWYIGSQTFNTPSAGRFFGEQWKGYDIPITLVVKKTPNKACFPDDDGYDSITKVFHLSQYPLYDAPIVTDTTYFQQVHHGSIEGTYRVIAPHQTDSIDMNFDVLIKMALGSKQVDVQNVDGNGDSCDNSGGRFLGAFSYRFMEIGKDSGGDPINSCNNWYGYVRNNLNGEAEISLQLRTPMNILNAPWVHYKGRKLN